MSDIGMMEAQRIMRERQGDADRLARQERVEHILRTEPPQFFDAMAKCVEESVKSFNLGMRLSGEDAMTFVYSSGLIEIGKRHKPFFLKKATLDHASNRVVIRTQTISITYRPGGSQDIWRFDVEYGELTLDGKNPIECAEALFVGTPDAFR